MLYNCPTCARRVSGNAEACPGCGEPDAGVKAEAYYRDVILPHEKATETRRREEERQRRLEWARAEQKRLAGNRVRTWGFTIAGVLVGIGIGSAVDGGSPIGGAFLGFLIGSVIGGATKDEG